MMDEGRTVIITEPCNGVRTIVLVGRTGNGKSATGNSILDRKAFRSTTSSVGVTTTCELATIVLEDGQILSVIDTPGLFDFSVNTKFAAKEIANCVLLAKDGIHAFILVFSVRTRFTMEEKATIQCLQSIFGSNFVDYTVIVFTGGDDLEEHDQTLEEYIGFDSPKPLQEILQLCKNRVVLFNNRADNEYTKAEQVQELLTLVNRVTMENLDQPFSHEFFGELEEGALKLDNNEQLKQITETVEQRLEKSILSLEQQIGEEKAARLQIDKLTQQMLTQGRLLKRQREQSWWKGWLGFFTNTLHVIVNWFRNSVRK